MAASITAWLAGTTALRFNLAHSHGLAVLAVTLGRELGVDVERVRPEVSTEGIAERHFSPREQAVLRAEDAGAAQGLSEDAGDGDR